MSSSTAALQHSDMLFSDRVMEDLMSRFQSTRASYELKLEDAEVIRAKFNAGSSSLYHPARSAPPQPLNSTHSAKEFRAWKVSAGSSFTARLSLRIDDMSSGPAAKPETCAFRKSTLQY